MSGPCGPSVTPSVTTLSPRVTLSPPRHSPPECPCPHPCSLPILGPSPPLFTTLSPSSSHPIIIPILSSLHSVPVPYCPYPYPIPIHSIVSLSYPILSLYPSLSHPTRILFPIPSHSILSPHLIHPYLCPIPVSSHPCPSLSASHPIPVSIPNPIPLPSKAPHVSFHAHMSSLSPGMMWTPRALTSPSM